MKRLTFMLVFIAMACDVSAKRPTVRWEAANIHSSMPTVHYSLLQLDATADLEADYERQRLIGKFENLAEAARRVNAAYSLSRGRTVVQLDDWRTLAFVDSSGEEFAPRFSHDGYSAEKVVVGKGDTVYLAVAKDMQAGRDEVLRLLNGRIIDSIPSPLRTLRGVRNDGSLMYWNVSSRSPKGLANDVIRSPEANIMIVSSTTTGPLVKAEIRVALETQFGRVLPWSNFARATEAGGSVWISPSSGSDLLRLAENGWPDLRVRWKRADSTVSKRELHSIRDDIASTFPKSWDRETRRHKLDEITRSGDSNRANAIDRIVGGRDGSVWVRERCTLCGVRKDSVFWLGFRKNGDLIGRLRLSYDTYVHELNEKEALLTPGISGKLFRVPVVLGVRGK